MGIDHARKVEEEIYTLECKWSHARKVTGGSAHARKVTEGSAHARKVTDGGRVMVGAGVGIVAGRTEGAAVVVVAAGAECGGGGGGTDEVVVGAGVGVADADGVTIGCTTKKSKNSSWSVASSLDIPLDLNRLRRGVNA